MRNIVKLNGLLFSCPHSKCEDDCPFLQIRTIPVIERIEYAKGLDSNKVTNLIEHHKACLSLKEDKN